MIPKNKILLQISHILDGHTLILNVNEILTQISNEDYRSVLQSHWLYRNPPETTFNF